MKLQMNTTLQSLLDEVAEVAGILWTKGWAERNAGNISINITEEIGAENRSLSALASFPLPRTMAALSGEVFYVTGTGRRMRDVAKAPLKQGAIVRVSEDGLSYDIIAEETIKPTSELPAHFSIHASFKESKSPNKVVLHTHPTDLVALSHIAEYKSEAALNDLLWAMHPETFIVVPRGMGVVPYEIPGTLELADKTLEYLKNHDVVVWEKHGVLAVGSNLSDVFDVIDTLSKSAQIYTFTRTMGFTPEGLTQQQITDLIEPFKLNV